MISAPIKKLDRPLDQEAPKSFLVRIYTPPPRPGIYHSMVLDCIGIDAETRLYLVPLPPIGDRPAYLGKFPEQYIIRLDPDEADYADF
ncbi:MAG: hypothetical protein HC860_14945 [Alkalinema sp. RU_4_3]|nr:hypothetical protein [Alkalinema sp. RU_4_3]